MSVTLGVPLSEARRPPSGIFPVDVLVTVIPNGAGGVVVTAAYGALGFGLGVKRIWGGVACEDLAAVGVSGASIALTFAADGSSVTFTTSAVAAKRAHAVLWVSM